MDISMLYKSSSSSSSSSSPSLLPDSPHLVEVAKAQSLDGICFPLRQWGDELGSVGCVPPDSFLHHTQWQCAQHRIPLPSLGG